MPRLRHPTIRHNVSFVWSPVRLLITSRGIQEHSGPSHHTTNLTSPLYLPLSTYVLVEHPPPHYAQRLDWVRGHHMPRLRHTTLTCSTVDTNGPSCYIRELPCATPSCISRHTRPAWSSGAALAALSCKAACSHVTSLLRRSLCCRL